jgi:hypothetical protein
LGRVPGSHLREITYNIQLKATVQQPSHRDGFLSYSLAGINRYNHLKEDCHFVKRFLVVLFLPEDRDEWLTQSEDELILKRCAWWSSLLSAPETDNSTAVTVYLPEANVFNVDAVNEIAQNIATKNPPTYQGHAFHS